MLMPEDIKRQLRKLNELCREYNHYLHKAKINFHEADRMDELNKETSICLDKLSELQEEHFSRE